MNKCSNQSGSELAPTSHLQFTAQTRLLFISSHYYCASCDKVKGDKDTAHKNNHVIYRHTHIPNIHSHLLSVHSMEVIESSKEIKRIQYSENLKSGSLPVGENEKSITISTNNRHSMFVPGSFSDCVTEAMVEASE